MRRKTIFIRSSCQRVLNDFSVVTNVFILNINEVTLKRCLELSIGTLPGYHHTLRVSTTAGYWLPPQVTLQVIQ